MQYPVWEIPFFGGGLLIACIAVLHVYIAHFAVGGGLFLVLTRRRALQEQSVAMGEYVKKHTRFFMLITMVYGSLTGVGIWFIIAMTSPRATLSLIHTYSFAWATEWLFFAGEIIALLVFYYTFDRMKPDKHQQVGWLYFLFGWLSLFFINGIITSMLTPGQWLATHNFWDGFFNPTFWPSLFFRSFLAFSIAGLFGFVTACRVPDNTLRMALMRYTAQWTAVSLLLLIPGVWWYFSVLPEQVQGMVTGENKEILPAVRWFLFLLPALLAGSLLMSVQLSRRLSLVVALCLLVLGQAYIGVFEWIREGARRPYVLYGYIYSSGLMAEEISRAGEEGFLGLAKWVRHREVTAHNRQDAGRELFMQQCLPCHSIAGPSNDILPLTAQHTLFAMKAQLAGQGKLLRYMPPFAGTSTERDALARYIVTGLHGRAEQPAKKDSSTGSEADTEAYTDTQTDKLTTPPPFDPQQAQYILTAWVEHSMQPKQTSFPGFTLGQKGNTLYSQLVRRGDSPELVTQGVRLSYLSGKGAGDENDHLSLNVDEQTQTWYVEEIGMNPKKTQAGGPSSSLATISAYDKTSGALLARIRLPVPVTGQWGCKTCHDSYDNTSSTQTAEKGQHPSRILQAHDRINGTTLQQTAQQQPIECSSCHFAGHPAGHPDALHKPDTPSISDTQDKAGNNNNSNNAAQHTIPSLSAAIHGWHAPYMANQEEESCLTCHGSAPALLTSPFQGLHKERELSCINCHGTLEDHSLALIKAEKTTKTLERMKAVIVPVAVEDIAAVPPRRAYSDSPDCLSCHADFDTPQTDDLLADALWTEDSQSPQNSSNPWTQEEQHYHQRKDMMDALHCASCHGTAHALWPASQQQGTGNNPANHIPLQYIQQAAPLGTDNTCGLCHIQTSYSMQDSAHHPVY